MGRHSRRIVRFATVMALASMSAVGCGKSAKPTRTGTPTSIANVTTSTTAPGIDVLPGASTSPVSVPVTSAIALLTDISASRHEGYDRVVFQFEASLPGYRVGYADKPLMADPSGQEVPLKGGYALVVRMERGAGADLSSNSLRITYKGPSTIEPNTPEIAELAKVGDFEAVLTWAIGTVDKVDFRVTTLDSPPRLVVDVRNH